MPKSPAPLKVRPLTLHEAAQLLDRSPRHVQTLAAAGWLSRTARGEYPLEPLVRGALRYYDDLLSRANKSASAARVTDARTEEIRLRIAERTRDLIPMEDAKAVMASVVSEVRAEIVGMGARITRDMELRRQIDAEADGILRRLADRAEAEAKALTAGNQAQSAP